MNTRNLTWEVDDILWGLTDENTDRQVCEKAFELIHKVRFMPTATVNNGQPENRIIDFNRLPDGNIYFMTSKGKPFYKQLCERPEIVANTVVDLKYALKIRAWVKDVTEDEWVWEEFFKLNPGTKKVYGLRRLRNLLHKMPAGRKSHEEQTGIKYTKDLSFSSGLLYLCNMS